VRISKWLIFCLVLVWISSCSSKQEVVHEDTYEPHDHPPPPPPPPNGVWSRVDSMAHEEKGCVYPGFRLVRSVDYADQKLPSGLRFHGFFYDVTTIGLLPDKNSVVFSFSRFNNPMHFNEKAGKMEDIFIDDESQDNFFFQITGKKRHFRLAGKQLLQAKLTAVTSAYGALSVANDNNYRIQAGELEGWLINDSTWQVKLNASYQDVWTDSIRNVTLKVDHLFRVAQPDTVRWQYMHSIEKQ
jgi:hypothetical protein